MINLSAENVKVLKNILKFLFGYVSSYDHIMVWLMHDFRDSFTHYCSYASN